MEKFPQNSNKINGEINLWNQSGQNQPEQTLKITAMNLTQCLLSISKATLK